MKNLKKFLFFLLKKEFYFGVFMTSIVFSYIVSFIVQMFPRFFDLDFVRQLFIGMGVSIVISVLGLLPAIVRFFALYILEQRVYYKELTQE